MRLIRALLIVFFTPFLALGQVGNEWLSTNQVYYKIPVANDGLYRLTRTDLAAAGVPVDQMDPRRIQLFHRGLEQAIIFQHAQLPANGVFDPSEYLEFYGKKNDGSLDAELYKPASSQPHGFYNLYNDTAYYYLTVHPSLQGKRMDNFTQANTSSLPKETSQQSERLELLTSSYATGQTFNGFVQLSSFNTGEGWSGPVVRENNFADVTITSLVNAVSADGLPKLEMQVLGRGSVNHKADIYVGPNTGSLRLLRTVTFFGFEANTFTDDLNWSDIDGTGKLTVRMQVLGTGGTDFISISYARVRFPQNFSMAGANSKLLTLKENPGNKSYVEIDNVPSGARVFDITDSNNIRTIGTSQTTTLNLVVDETQLTQRTLFVTNQTITPTGIKRVVFRSLASANANYVIISHKAFQKPAVGVTNPLKAYASYRASAAGGDYDTLVVTMDQLYDQFSYGESTPVAVFRFIKFLETRKRPDYIFLVGKGLDVANRYYRNPTAFPVFKDFVPSSGRPGSDMFYTVALSSPTNEPSIPIGRLSAITPEQVVFYLNKVIEQEASPFNDLWKKRVLHLSGGIAAGEPETFKSFMEDFGATAADVYLGGSVTAIAKRSLAAQELINISDEVNKGLGLITFFGHSSTSTTDFDIGFVTDPQLGYSNKGRYPILLINGCNAGAFYNNNVLFGEDWVNAADKGAIGFIAHSFFGFTSTLKRYSDFFYEVAYGDSVFIRKGIGDIQKEVARRYLEVSSPSEQNVTQVLQMVLLGDPAAKIFGTNKPDFAVDNSSIKAESFDGKAITTATDSFALKIIVKNFGAADGKPLSVSIKRTFSDNSFIKYDSTYSGVFFQDTLYFTVPNKQILAGTSQFEVNVDAALEYNEISEANNNATFSLFIPLNGTKNLFPTDFGIVNATQQMLTFQSANLLDSLRFFDIELDTLNTFTSAYKKSASVKAEVLGKWSVELLPKDSLTYYWRTRLKNPGTDESTSWEQSSFTYIQNGSEGWGQFHFPQFVTNGVDNLLINESVRKLEFTESVTPVLIKTFGDNHPAASTEVSVKIDGVEYNLATQGQPCRDNTINLIAFNRTNTIPYPAIPFNFQDPRTCGREPQVIVSFTSAEVFNNGTNDLIQYVNDVAVGDSVILFTIGNPVFTTWNAAIVSKLSEIGLSAAQFSALQNGEPVIIYGKKGSVVGSALVFTAGISPKPDQELIINRQITGRLGSGAMRTLSIGPAKTWNTLSHKSKLFPNDLISVDVFGINSLNEKVLLIDNANTFTDLSFIDATEHPVLELEFAATDDIDLTPAQLRYWVVTYETLPEGIAIFKDDVVTTQLKEGEQWSGRYGFVNISSKQFSDSLIVQYAIRTLLSNSIEDRSLKIKAPLPGDTTSFSISSQTIKKAGLNSVSVTVNPNILPEQYVDNNTINLAEAFEVQGDSFNPVLRVTVDGRLLEDEDLVSANPVIKISLWDENKFLLKKDTLGMRILLQYPCTSNCVPQVIYFSRSDVAWTPATETSPFETQFTPAALPAGLYTLQVFAEDSRENESGEAAYSIRFEVRDESLLSVLKPYPNPSNGSLTFTALIAGNDLPSAAVLDIISPAGKMLESITIRNSGWHIGTNYLETSLPTTLSNGLYVYSLRISGKINTLLRGQLVINR
jgi:hypothetical protein